MLVGLLANRLVGLFVGWPIDLFVGDGLIVGGVVACWFAS